MKTISSSPGTALIRVTYSSNSNCLDMREFLKKYDLRSSRGQLPKPNGDMKAVLSHI